MTQKSDLTVFVDEACPLCRREVKFYRRMDRHERITWHDLRTEGAEALPTGVHCGEALERIHAMTGDGQVLSGGAVFAAIWRRLPGMGWLGRMFQTPPFSWLLEGGYRLFARIRPLLSRTVARWERRTG